MKPDKSSITVIENAWMDLHNVLLYFIRIKAPSESSAAYNKSMEEPVYIFNMIYDVGMELYVCQHVPIFLLPFSFLFSFALIPKKGGKIIKEE